MLSLIVPMYHESEGVEAFFDATLPVLESLHMPWEVIAVDDGSTDDTFTRLKAWHTKEPRIKLVRFSRNFGKEAALTAGLDLAKGDAVIVIDADLQDPPALIPEMLAKWREGHPVVLGQRRSRTDEGALKKAGAAVFYWLLNKISEVPIIPNTGDFRLLDKQVVAAACSLKERTRLMRGIMGWSGHKICLLPFDRPARAVGVPKQSLRKLLGLALDAFISLSDAPLRLPTLLGVLICAGAAFSALMGAPWMASLLFFCVGLQFLCLGLLGEYLARIYRETRAQPLYHIAETQGTDA